jgi:hypothetical protein
MPALELYQICNILQELQDSSKKLQMCDDTKANVWMHLRILFEAISPPGVNFTNILRTAFTYISFARSYFVLAF